MDKWDPLVEIEIDPKYVQETIEDFGTDLELQDWLSSYLEIDMALNELE